MHKQQAEYLAKHLQQEMANELSQQSDRDVALERKLSGDDDCILAIPEVTMHAQDHREWSKVVKRMDKRRSINHAAVFENLIVTPVHLETNIPHRHSPDAPTPEEERCGIEIQYPVDSLNNKKQIDQRQIMIRRAIYHAADSLKLKQEHMEQKQIASRKKLGESFTEDSMSHVFANDELSLVLNEIVFKPYEKVLDVIPDPAIRKAQEEEFSILLRG